MLTSIRGSPDSRALCSLDCNALSAVRFFGADIRSAPNGRSRHRPRRVAGDDLIRPDAAAPQQPVFASQKPAPAIVRAEMIERRQRFAHSAAGVDRTAIRADRSGIRGSTGNIWY
jgi:hypothetical protein